MDERREEALEHWERTPEDRKERMRAAMRRHLAKKAAERHGEEVPPEEVPEELVEEWAVAVLGHIQGDVDARWEEHITTEEFNEWTREELSRLYVRHRGSVPEDVLLQAVLARARRERPEAFAYPRRRKEG